MIFVRLAVLLAVVIPCADGADSFVREGLLFSWDARDAAPDAKTVPDASGHGRTATVAGPGRWLQGPARFELDGKAALVAPKSIKPQRLSIEAVFRVDRVYSAGLQLIVTVYRAEPRPKGAEGNPRQWVLEIRGAPPQRRTSFRGHLSFGVFGTDGGWHFALSDEPITRGWHHALGTFNGHAVRLYLDGKLQDLSYGGQEGRYEGAVHQPSDEVVGRPAVGVPSPKGRNCLDGAVALARMYDRGLSAAEAMQNWRCAQGLGLPFGHKPPAPAVRPKPPFRVLFSNDTTNVLTCVSPYHKKREPFTAERLQATVDEVQGVDVHMLQPGLGWIPWWKSKVYPLEEHCRWFHERTGLRPNSFHQFLLGGGDMIQVFIDRCRARGVVPFVSFRLNDAHCLEDVGAKTQRSESVSRFYADHPEYRLGPSKRSWIERVHNWAIPAVREHKFAYIREICEQYDIDGFELDFMRHCSFFNAEETTFKERSRIVTEFVARVRALLDRTAKPGQHRWLCARVPFMLSAHGELGLDLPAMVRAGLDMVNLSAHFFTNQQSDIEWVCRLAPGAAVYLEMTHCTFTGTPRGGYDSFNYMRTTDEQFYTGAHLAYARGAAGVSLFNFVYYREHGTRGRGPFTEPPFHVLPRLGQRDWLAKQPQWYVLARTWYHGGLGRPLPVELSAGESRAFTLDLAPRAGGEDGLLRVRTQEDGAVCDWTVTLNRQRLAPARFVLKPLVHPYDAALGDSSQYVAFRVPRACLRDGFNSFVVRLDRGGPVTVDYVDLVLP